MSGSVEIATWIHEYELRALEKYLAMEGTDTEQVMQKALADLPRRERSVLTGSLHMCGEALEILQRG